MSASPMNLTNLNRELQAKIKTLEDTNQRLEKDNLRLKSDYEKAFGYAQNYLNQLEKFEKNFQDKELLYHETKTQNVQLKKDLESKEAFLTEVKQETLERQQSDEDLIDTLEKDLESKQEIINDLKIQLASQIHSNNENDKMVKALQAEIDIYKSQLNEKNTIINELELNLSNEKKAHLDNVNELEKYSNDLEIKYLKQLNEKDDKFKNEIEQFQAKEDHLKQEYEIAKNLNLKHHLSPDTTVSVPEKAVLDKRTPRKSRNFSVKIISYLTKMFNDNKYLNEETLAKIKIKTNLEENQIIQWFITKRLRKH